MSASLVRPAAPATRDDGRRIVLVVDDAPEDAEIVGRYLRRDPEHRYEVRHAQLGEEALGLCLDVPAAERPHLVLLDYNLPDMTGIELLDLLAEAHAQRDGRAGERGLPVPVVMLTGSSTHLDTAVTAMQHGALDYLAKDQLSVPLLRRAIDTALERFASRRLLEAQRDELERRNLALDAYAERTQRLLTLATALSGSLTPEEVAAVTLRETMPALGAVRAALALVDPGSETLEVVHVVGVPEDAVERRLPLAASAPLAVAARTGRALWPQGSPSVVAVGREADPVEGGGASGVTVPLEAGGRPIGAMSFGFDVPEALGVDERAFLLTAARQGAEALERARLYAAEHRAHAEAERARAEAERANRAKSDFLAVMSHELRTPLNAIAGYVDLLELGVRGPLSPAQAADLGRVKRAQQHLLSLINEVLDFARIESGRAEFRVDAVPAHEVVAEVHALVAPQLRARALEFVVEACDAEVRLCADRDKVRQVLANLLSNAIKFTPPGGRVTLACATEGAVTRLRVVDTGCGIPPAKLESVFEPFVQVETGHTRTVEGTGLGLAISRELARGMGGELAVESTEGEGSAFTLTLPTA